jgi:hypothetical protein
VQEDKYTCVSGDGLCKRITTRVFLETDCARG